MRAMESVFQLFRMNSRFKSLGFVSSFEIRILNIIHYFTRRNKLWILKQTPIKTNLSSRVEHL